MKKSKSFFGLDFGTTNSSFSIYDGDTVKVLSLDPLARDPKVVRSALYFDKEGRSAIGKRAIQNYLQDHAERKASFKKFVQADRKVRVINPFTRRGEEVSPIMEVEESDAGRLLLSLKTFLKDTAVDEVNIFGRFYTLEELIGTFLRELKSRAEERLNREIDKVIFGRPVIFSENAEEDKLAQRRLEKAAKVAGFGSFEFEFEPIGAAYNYGLGSRKSRQVLVFDFGGGTLDLTIISFPDKKVLSVAGARIGGDLINQEIFKDRILEFFGSRTTYGDKELPVPAYILADIVDWYRLPFLKTHRILSSLGSIKIHSTDPQAVENLTTLIKYNLGFMIYEKIDQLKQELSYKKESRFVFSQGGLKIEFTMTRKEFENLIRFNLRKIEELLSGALKAASLSPENVDKIVCTGGSSLIPAVGKILKKKFGRGKIESSDIFTSVSAGLSLIARERFS